MKPIPIVALLVGMRLTGANEIGLAEEGKPPGKVDRRAVEELIAQLVSPNKDPNPEMEDLTRFPAGYDKEAQAKVREAHQKLEELGTDAFPILIEHMADERYSETIAIAIWCSFSVGEICLRIIDEQVVPGTGYKNRNGADGKVVPYEDYFERYWRAQWDKYERSVKKRKRSDFLRIRQGGMRKWWNENQGRSLKEMKIDALKWTIERERRFGFQTRREEAEILDPLIQELADLSSCS